MKKIALITTILILLVVPAVLSMPLTTLAAGAVSVTYQSSPLANAADTGGDGNGFEGATPEGAYADGGTAATDADSGDVNNTDPTQTGCDRHRFYNYGMDIIPSGSAIAGITVRADIAVDSLGHSPWTAIQLSWDGGTSWTAVIQQALSQTAELTYTYGGPANNWGRTWSASELTDTYFRVRVINGDGHQTQNARDFSLDYIPVSITYTAPWDSYRDDYSTPLEDYNSGTLGTIYMNGTGFADGSYDVTYFDAFDAFVGTDAGIAVSGGILQSSMPCNTDPSAEPGTWDAEVYFSGTLIAADTFTVQQNVIPEFPTIFAAIGVVGLCFGIYWLMKRRLVYVKG